MLLFFLQASLILLLCREHLHESLWCTLPQFPCLHSNVVTIATWCLDGTAFFWLSSWLRSTFTSALASRRTPEKYTQGQFFKIGQIKRPKTELKQMLSKCASSNYPVHVSVIPLPFTVMVLSHCFHNVISISEIRHLKNNCSKRYRLISMNPKDWKAFFSFHQMHPILSNWKIFPQKSFVEFVCIFLCLKNIYEYSSHT